MLRRLWERRRSVRALRRLDALADLPAHELAAVDRLTSDVHVPAGRVLAREGEPGLDFAIVVEGTALVSRGDHAVAVLAPGTFFGEMALIAGGRRTATVVAEQPMRLLVASRAEFERLLDAAPRLAARISVTAARRSADTPTLLAA